MEFWTDLLADHGPDYANTSKSYPIYFNNFSLNSFIELLSLKRDAFSYENEVRLFLIPDLSQNRSVGKSKHPTKCIL